KLLTMATQTNKENLVLALQLRIDELKAILQENNEEEISIPVQQAEINDNQKATPIFIGHTVTFGANNTKADRSKFDNIDWKCYSLATRALLDAVFDRGTLATCTISGKQRGIIKLFGKLDPLKIQDILQLVQEKCQVSELHVRNIIVKKCQDTRRRFNRKQV
ncbi:hypothetical protein KR215_007368, partial [Drosophila sulfurigaster]